MDVSEAALWFNDVTLEGWNGSGWVAGVAAGDFLSYDRFITERTFGAKKRVFHTPESTKIDPATYPVVRTPDGAVWIVSSRSADIASDVTYAQSYILLEAMGTADLIRFTTETLASGAEGPLSEDVIATVWCDIERYTAGNSDLFPNVVYGSYEVTLPFQTTVDGEMEIEFNGVRYAIEEIIPELLTVVCRAVKRG